MGVFRFFHSTYYLRGLGVVNATVLMFSNATSAIPLRVVSETNWTQYSVSLIIGSVFVLYFLWKMFREYLSDPVTWVCLWWFSRRTGRKTFLIRHNQAGFFGGQMITRDLTGVLKSFLRRARGGDVNLVLHTPGGCVFSTLYLSRLLKEYSGRVFVYVPQYAMSGGTVLALSGDHLIMDGGACLGPVDPQVSGFLESGSADDWRRVLKIKRERAKDTSIVYSNVADKVERTIRQHIFGLTGNASFTALLVEGSKEHIYQVDGECLKRYGVPFQVMPKTEAVVLNYCCGLKSDNGVVTT